ncbi:MAG: UrcA family protein [Maricaulaceae bacterium]
MIVRTLILAAAAVIAPAALAQAPETRSVTVYVTGAESQAEIDVAIARAARRVCDVGSGRQPLFIERAQRDCVEDAIANASIDLAGR